MCGSLSPSFHPYLDTEVAPVYVVPQEEVACVGRRAAHFKQLHQVEKLAVDVSTHCGHSTKRQFTRFHSAEAFRLLQTSDAPVVLCCQKDNN